MSRTLKVTGNHVMYDGCMISKGYHVKFAPFVLLAVSEEAKHDFRVCFEKDIEKIGFFSFNV